MLVNQDRPNRLTGVRLCDKPARIYSLPQSYDYPHDQKDQTG